MFNRWKTKLTWVIVVVTLVSTTSVTFAQSGAQEGMWTANKQLVLNYFSAINQNDADTLALVLSPQIIQRDTGITDGIEGTQSYAAMLNSAFTDLQINVDTMIEDDDYVLARIAMTGQHTGEFLGLPPTNQPLYLNAMELFRVADEQLVEHWSVLDQFGFYMQSGFIPSDGAVYARREGGLTLATPTDDATESGNLDILLPYASYLFYGGDIDSFVDTYYGDFYLNHVESGDLITQTREQSRQSLMTAFEPLLAAISEPEVTDAIVLAEGDMVGIYNIYAATSSGEFMGAPPTNGRIAVKNADIWRFEAGRAVEHWGFLDTLGLLGQLGLIEQPS